MSRSRSAPPRFDRQARLPLLLTLPLAATLALQLALPADDALPPVGPLQGGRRASDAALPAPPVPGMGRGIRAGLFTPPPPTPTNGGGVATGPLVLGSVAVGVRRFVLLQSADGKVVRRVPGARIGDWRLAAIEAGGVRLVHGHDTQTVPFGSRVSAPPSAATGEQP